MIRISDLEYGVLRIPALSIPEGHTAVIGRNGSGKTTFLRLLSGLVLPVTGEIAIDGRPPRSVETGWVDEFPDRNMLFPLVRDEIAAPLRFSGMACREVEYRIQSLAYQTDILHLLDRPFTLLSGGEKALVALTTSLAGGPELLVLDEFDSHLDEKTISCIRPLIGGVGQKYIVWCTQNMDLAKDADYLIVLHEGKVRHFGRPEEVFPHLIESCLYPPSWRCLSAPDS